MNAAKIVADYLKTVAAVTDLVPAARIYWPWVSSTASPSVLHIRTALVEGGRLHNLDYAAPSVQVSVFGKIAADVEEAKEAVIAALRNRAGLMGSAYVVSTYRDDRFFYDNTWFHAPITFGLRYQEV